MNDSLNVKKIVIYSCIADQYDNFNPGPSMEDNIHRVLFTDRQVDLQGWECRALQSPPRLRTGHDINRYHKLFPHLLFPDFSHSIYVDGNIKYNGDLVRLVDATVEAGVPLAIFKHPDGRNLDQEVLACSNFNKFDSFDTLRAEKQLSHYRGQGFDTSSVIGANYLIVRTHSHSRLQLAMSLWWSQLFEFAKRDQLSLTYSLWQTGTPWVFLDDLSGIHPEMLVRSPHKFSWKRTRERAIRKLKRMLPARL